MHMNYLPIPAEISFMLVVAMVFLATRWPYSADAVRLDCISICDKAQGELKKALETTDPRMMYKALAMVAFLLGQVETKLKDVREK